MKISNLPLIKIIKVMYSVGIPLSVLFIYLIFYWAWKYFSPLVMITVGLFITVLLTYNIALKNQYFFFIHENGEFKFKKIIFYKSVPVKEIKKFEIYYPGPTTPEKFNKEDTEFKWWGKRDPSGFQMLFYLRNGQIVKVGRTYIPIAEYIRKHLLTQGAVCVERYLSSLNPEKYIDVIYKPSNGRRDKIEHFQNDFSGEFSSTTPD